MTKQTDLQTLKLKTHGQSIDLLSSRTQRPSEP